MRKEIILPTLALGGGVVGFGLRRWELATAFEPETGLVIAKAPATWALLALTVVVLLALLLLAKGPHIPLDGYDHAFAANGSKAYMMATLTSVGLFFLSGIVGLMELPTVYEDSVRQAQMHGATPSMLSVSPRAILPVLCILSAFCVFRVARNNYRGEGAGRMNAGLLFPGYTACMWLIVAYQQKSGDPVVLDYVWQLFAVILVVLGTYFIAGFAFERAKVFRTSLAALGGAYFSLVALADGHSPSLLLLYGAFLLYLVPSATVLLWNAQHEVRMPRDSEA